MKNSNRLKKYKILTAIFALAFLAALAYIFMPSLFYSKVASLAIPQLSTVGFKQVNVTANIIDQNTATATLYDECYELTANIEPIQADSILSALSNEVGPRPNAHDFAKDVFTSLKIDVLMLKITEQRDNMFFAKIVLRQGNTILNYDIRPSDGMAIALRMKVPIYINETLLTTNGKKLC